MEKFSFNQPYGVEDVGVDVVRNWEWGRLKGTQLDRMRTK